MFRRYTSDHGERGQSLVEMVVVLPLLLLLLIGVVDFGRAFFTFIAITNASREGARMVSRFPLATDTSVRQVVVG